MAIAGGNEILLKGGVLVVMCVLLLIPLGLLRGLITERTALREQAYQRVANGYGGAQTVGGLVIVVPVGEEEQRLAYLLPDELDYAVTLRPAAEARRVGIFDVPVYEAQIEIRGRFDRRGLRARLRDVHAEEGRWNEATVLIPISDVRGIRDSVVVEMPFVYGQTRPSQEPGLGGLVQPLVADAAQSADGIEFHVTLTLGGSRAFGVLPLGARTTLAMKSTWPHPSFKDTFLPSEKTIRSDGFDARWVVLGVNRPFDQGWLADDAAITAAVAASAFGVDLYQPVDAYQRADRAVKYAGLFLALTFMAFFCYERVARVRVHPFQYGLVGLALSVFYLLLLALGEHLAFGVAYAIAATALVLLLGSYVAGALGSRRHGAFVAATFALAYALLYALIASEDYALLVGAIAVFAVLATSMLLTRRVDWYAASAA